MNIDELLEESARSIPETTLDGAYVLEKAKAGKKRPLYARPAFWISSLAAVVVACFLIATPYLVTGASGGATMGDATAAESDTTSNANATFSGTDEAEASVSSPYSGFPTSFSYNGITYVADTQDTIKNTYSTLTRGDFLVYIVREDQEGKFQEENPYEDYILTSVLDYTSGDGEGIASVYSLKNISTSEAVVIEDTDHVYIAS